MTDGGGPERVTPDRAASAPVTSHRDPFGVVTVTLNLPELRNALRPDLVRGLIEAMAAIEDDDQARAVVLTGAGPVFCSGGDLGAMKAMATWSYEENLADSKTMDAMFASVERCSRPVVARVNGAAMGGGTGLVACADIAVASDTARFALSEVRLGIIPAVVGTYVAPKIGASWARRLLITGERFDAPRARDIGLVHEVVPAGELDGAVALVLEHVLARPAHGPTDDQGPPPTPVQRGAGHPGPSGRGGRRGGGPGPDVRGRPGRHGRVLGSPLNRLGKDSVRLPRPGPRR